MTPEKLSKIEEIYHRASEMEPTRRSSFVLEACEDDEEIRLEVESLLAAREDSRGFLETPPESLVAEMMAERGSDLVGREIGHYKVLRQLGAGGMGEVYLAEDSKLHRQVALKMLPGHLADNHARNRDFEQEALAISALNHPNIITIHEIAEADGANFITTEFIDGLTLRELLKQRVPSVEETLAIVVQIARALESAHGVRIIHRDIKPANVMVRPDGIVKVLDFGLAKLLPGGDDFAAAKAAETAPNHVMGTVSYMSPEQAAGREVDSRTDIFSFGVLLYEMLTGRLPFVGDSSFEVLAAVLSEEPVPLPSDTVSSDLASLVMRCLQKDRSERIQSIGEVRSEIERLRRTTYAGQSADSDRSTGGFSAMRFMTLPVARYRMRVLLIAAVFMLITSAAAFYAYRQFAVQKQIRSIAVMPFINESGNQDVDYLSEGMAENLIRSLSGVPQLSIKARSIVFGYKNKTASPRVVGSELKVDAVLLGRLVQRGDGLKVTLELVDTETEDILWTEIYERKLSSLVLLESEIATHVAQNLRIRLTSAEKEQVAKTFTENSEAQQLYLKGRFHWNKRKVADLEIAIDSFNKAIALDAEHAPAYAGLADSYALMPLYASVPPKEYMPKAKKAALKALELNPDLAEPHASLGFIITTYEYDWAGAEREYKLAILLNPNYATAHQWYAEHLAFRGRHDEALTQIGLAAELDPFSVVINRMKGNILLFSGRPDEAIAQLMKTAELFPENPTVRFNLGDAYAKKKMYRESVRHHLDGLRLNGWEPADLEMLQNAFGTGGWSGFWQAYRDILIYEREQILKDDKNAHIHAETYAFAYAATGDRERTMEYLNLAYEQRDATLVSIKMTEFYDILKDDSRYRDLLRKIGLPE